MLLMPIVDVERAGAAGVGGDSCMGTGWGAARTFRSSPLLGSWAIHLNGFSTTIGHFDGGDGELALHGRGGASLLDPLGSARSHGCIRVDNGAIGFIASHAPLGTPVIIH